MFAPLKITCSYTYEWIRSNASTPFKKSIISVRQSRAGGLTRAGCGYPQNYARVRVEFRACQSDMSKTFNATESLR